MLLLQNVEHLKLALPQMVWKLAGRRRGCSRCLPSFKDVCRCLKERTNKTVGVHVINVISVLFCKVFKDCRQKLTQHNSRERFSCQIMRRERRGRTDLGKSLTLIVFKIYIRRCNKYMTMPVLNTLQACHENWKIIENSLFGSGKFVNSVTIA